MMTRAFLDRPDCRLWYEVTGSGPALIFAHGLGGNHLSWWQQVAHFSARYTCVAFAHRGFAPSSPIAPDPLAYGDDLAALIDHLGFADVRLVAQSMGGWTCLDYALKHPKRVRALVLASTSGRLDFKQVPDFAGEFAVWERDSAAARAEFGRLGAHVAAGSRMQREQPALHFLYREIDDLNALLDKEGVRARLMASRNLAPESVRALDLPVLFVTGVEDPVFPAGAARALAPFFPNARVEAFAAAGHSVYFERAEWFNRTVEAFLAQAA
jgi:3-oxoadipate enol-lactonase